MVTIIISFAVGVIFGVVLTVVGAALVTSSRLNDADRIR